MSTQQTSFFPKNKNELERTGSLSAQKIIFFLLIAGSILAALKTIFIGLHVDEEYQISMGYRLLHGEKLFKDLWDPHQTSAFLTEFLMWIFQKLFHTLQGSVIWVRFCGVMIHLGISVKLCRFLETYLSPEYSFYLGILYFNLLPKDFSLPEYSNLFVWTLTLLLLELDRLRRTGSLFSVVLCGFWMCVMVLSYPSSLLFFPLICVFLIKEKKAGTKAFLLFALVCAIGGLSYLFLLIQDSGSIALLIDNLKDLWSGNSSHTHADHLKKTLQYLKDFGVGILICSAYSLIAFLCMGLYSFFKKTSMFSRVLFFYLVLAISSIHQILHWLLMIPESEMNYYYTIYLFLLAVTFLIIRDLPKELKKVTLFWSICSILTLFCVLVLTDLSLFASSKYMIPGFILGLTALMVYSGEKTPRIFEVFSRGLLLLICFTAIFVNGWRYPAKFGAMSNITQVRGIVRVGPATGILTEYMTSYIFKTTWREMQELVPPGCSLLVVADSPMGYMYQDVTISSYTTICAPSYNETLLKYWEKHPERYPDIIAVTCWFGNTLWNPDGIAPDSWIMQWIENEYPASRVVDGSYFRYYIK